MNNLDVVLFLRKKIPGENSIEELAKIICAHNSQIRLVEFPHYGKSIKEIFLNIRFAKKNAGTVNHFFSSSELIVAPFIRGYKIVTWHDVRTAFYTRNSLKRWLKKYLLRYIPMLFCDKITCISNHTYDELINYFPLVKDKTIVIHNPYNPSFEYVPKTMGEIPVILHIGTAERKNLIRVIEALNGVRCHLIIIGKLTKEQWDLLRKYNIDYENHFDVDFATIKQKYIKSDIVSFPSLYEGFGMPIIEGQAVGRPILTSTAGSIPEIASQSVMYVDAKDVKSIRAGFIELLNSASTRQKLIELGLQNINRFSATNITNEYNSLYYNYK